MQRPRSILALTRSSTTTLAAILLVTSHALAGPTFEEVPDAGSTPTTAQPVSGSGAVGRIKGELTATADAVDFEDVYLICITDPAGFSATVDPVSTNFDTQLWLFKLDGKGLLANDNDLASFPTIYSKLTPVATDGSGAALTQPGLYFLAISSKANRPVSSDGQIFNDPTPNDIEVTGPDGPGGNSAIQGWTQSPGTVGGKYAIDLTGVKFFVPSCEIKCPLGAAIDDDAFSCAPFPADVNGGCTEPGNPLQDIGVIAPGAYRAVCGTTGVELFNGIPANKDRDWYRLTVGAPGYVRLWLITETLNGVPAPNARLTLRKNDVCPDEVELGEVVGGVCPLPLGPIPVTPGPHVVIVTLDGTLPPGPLCPVQYVVWIDQRPPKYLGCGESFAGACDVPHPSPSCNDTACCDMVCAMDPACCEESWDASCALNAILTCAGYECVGDLDNNGVVNGADLAILLGQWNSRTKITADLDDDGIVNASDLAILLGAWGSCVG